MDTSGYIRQILDTQPIHMDTFTIHDGYILDLLTCTSGRQEPAAGGPDDVDRKRDGGERCLLQGPPRLSPSQFSVGGSLLE